VTSRDYDAARSCKEHGDKRPFRNEHLALLAVRTIRRGAPDQESRPRRAYPCAQCGRWFLTSAP
jgi:hypothetical protein